MEVSPKVILILLCVLGVFTLGAHRWTFSLPSSAPLSSSTGPNEVIEVVTLPPPTTTEEPTTLAPSPADVAVARALGEDGCGLALQSAAGETRGGGCLPEGLYVSRWGKRLAQPTRKEWTIVDIGCNKGFPLQEMLEALGLLEYRNIADGNPFLCGACFDCNRRERYPIDAERVPKFARIFAYDINTDNVNFAQKKFTNVSSRVTINATAAAVGAPGEGNQTQKSVLVYDQGFAHEESKIISEQQRGSFPAGTVKEIPITTVDAEMARHRVTGIDILLTDTEGHDYIVADGAAGFLDTGRVGLYIFETWGKNIKLAQHVERLHNASFKCYFAQGHGGRTRDLVPISGACWRDEYNIVGWSNVVCGNRRFAPELVGALDELATSTAK